MSNLPIGFIDSGVGGLTVVKEVMKVLPNEEILFFGDSARNPYGPLPLDVVHQYVRQMAAFLVNKGIKLLVIACNTATVSSLEILQKELPIPVIGVIEAGSKAAAELTQNNEIGIIATEATVNSCEYDNKIKSYSRNVHTHSKAIPEFVELVERNELDNLETKKVISEALKEFKDTDIDTFVLGCTHYPLLQPYIQEYFGEEMTIVNPAVNTAQQVKDLLKAQKIDKKTKPKELHHTFFTTGPAELFTKIASQWLDTHNFDVKHLPVEELEKYGQS